MGRYVDFQHHVTHPRGERVPLAWVPDQYIYESDAPRATWKSILLATTELVVFLICIAVIIALMSVA